MAKNLTQLTARTATADSDLIHVNSGGTDYKETKIDFLKNSFIVKAYSANYTIAGNTGLIITANDLGLSVPSGYTAIGITHFTSGNSSVYVRGVNSRAAGTTGSLYLYNVTGTSISSTCYVTYLYVRTGMVDLQI